jgi:hypothetical protein
MLSTDDIITMQKDGTVGNRLHGLIYLLALLVFALLLLLVPLETPLLILVAQPTASKTSTYQALLTHLLFKVLVTRLV